MVLHGIALHLMILHSPSCHCIVSYGVAWYCIVGFGAPAVSRKTPTYFIAFKPVYTKAFKPVNGSMWQSVKYISVGKIDTNEELNISE